MAVDAGSEGRDDRDGRSEGLVDLHWGYCVAGANGRPQAVANDAGRAQI
ncbi:MAG: hypothetical protein R3E64_17615 [Halioglobus sp.]